MMSNNLIASSNQQSKAQHKTILKITQDEIKIHNNNQTKNTKPICEIILIILYAHKYSEYHDQIEYVMMHVIMFYRLRLAMDPTIVEKNH